jgi:hypothetical protein
MKDQLDGDLPKDVLYDQREVNFVEAEDDGQTKAGMGTSKSGKELMCSLIMKQKKDALMPPPGTPHPELEDSARKSGR